MSEFAEPGSENEGQPSQPTSWWRLQLPRLIDVVLTASISATLACLTLIVVGLMFGLKESGSAADWLATIFNGVVAIAAVAAFIVARSWLPQLTTQEGYKTAIQLVNDQYIQLGEAHSPAAAVEKAMAAFNNSAIAGLQTNLDSYNDAMRQLEIELQAARQNWEEIKNYRFCLHTYGLIETPRYKADLETMLTAYETSLPLGEGLLTSLNSDLTRRRAAKNKSELITSDGNEIWRTRLAADGQKLNADYVKYIAAISKIRVSHAKVFSDHPTIGKLFKVRK
ncbi:hypothetical protein J1785_06720 [Rahnella sp. SL6]|uniref:hypothetical protein n=1 Tax=Rahnella perminowiae TaxID=2816244 RepID=UPI001C27BE33|nr:hypothetical protein [Rahnella perminowiae]MBU9809436.1 hypothetical protein [Rahnella perminowiae]